MKIALILAASILTLSACSSSPKYPETAPAQVEQSTKAIQALTTELQTSGGALQIKFDDQGNWLALAATGTADVYGGDNATAIKVARMRANATIAEFLSNGVKSSRTVDTLAKTLANNNAKSDGEGVDERSNNIARKVTERMSESSQAMLKGVMVTGTVYDGETATVTVGVSAVTIRGAQMVRKQMSGMMQ
mgnify:CR=1 FL=1